MPDALDAGGRLGPGESLDAGRGNVHLEFRTDGDLVLFCDRADGRQTRWHSNTAGLGGCECALLDDGALEIRDGQGNVVWRSGVTAPVVLAGRLHDRPLPGDLIDRAVGNARLVVQADENVVIFLGDRPVWATGTSLVGEVVADSALKHFFVVEPDGTRAAISAEAVVDRFGGLGYASILDPAQMRRWPKKPPPVLTAAVPPVSPGDFTLCIDREAVATGALPPRQNPPGPPVILSDGSIGGEVRQALASEPAMLWDVGSTLRVKIFGGSALVRRKIREIAEEWTQHANIHFQWVDPDQPAVIRVNCNADGSSWSVIGRTALWIPFDIPTMNFGWFTDSTSNAEFRRVILHEFGHALGFIHEHESPAAGIAWDKPKVYEYYWKTFGWDTATVDQQVFSRYSTVTTNFSAFDPKSIMLYEVPAGLTLDGWSQDWNYDLSSTDKHYAAYWYPHAPTPANATGQLRGFDGDLIKFNVEYGVVAADQVAFVLNLSGNVTWWKAIEIPADNTYRLVQLQGSTAKASATVPVRSLDVSRSIRFWKAKFLGVHTLLPDPRWDVLTALPGGSRVTLDWFRDG